MILEGKGGIKVELVLASTNYFDVPIYTFKLHYHRFIHGELLTHRLFSRNSSSSRAIPVDKMLDYIKNNPAYPIHWGKNKTGMQADEECTNILKFGKSDISYISDELWLKSCKKSLKYAKSFNKSGYHKQIVNRLTEPYQFMNTILTATEFTNFFKLRIDKSAQPEIQELAQLMQECIYNTSPQYLTEGQYHLPFIDFVDGVYYAYDRQVTLDEAIKISVSLCAQVSYRKEDYTIEKADKIFNMLIGMQPKHLSPFEHIAKPFKTHDYTTLMELNELLDETDVVHNDLLFKNNFRCWEQIRNDYEYL